MSGRRQHFIPKLLLKGFLDEQDLLHVYGAGGNYFAGAIDKVAVEGHFYFHEKVGTADPAITNDVEPLIAKSISLWRQMPSRTSVVPSDARFVMAHILTRTDNIRDLIKMAMSKMITQVREARGTDAYRQRIDKSIDKMVHEFREKIRRGLLANPQFRMLTHQALENMINSLTPPRPTPEAVMATKSYKDLDKALADLHSQLPDLLASSQIKHLQLGKEAHPDKPERFVDWNWSIHEFADHELILGDGCIIEAKVLDGALQDTQLPTADRNAIFLPLSRTRVLAGYGPAVQPTIDADSLNVASARRSVNFFVAGSCADKVTAMQPQIGTVTKEIDSLVKRAVDEMLA